MTEVQPVPQIPPGAAAAMAALRPMAEALIAQFRDMDARIKWIQSALIELNKKVGK